MNRPHSIRTHLAISQVLIITLSLGIMGFIFSARLQSQIMEELGIQMLDRVQVLAASLEKDDDYRADERVTVLTVPGTDINVKLIAVFIDEGQKVHNLTASEIAEPVQESILDISHEVLPEDPVATEIIHRPDGAEQMYVVDEVESQDPAHPGIVCLLLSLDPVKQYITRQRFALGGFTLGLGILGILTSVLLTRPLISRARDVRALAFAVTQPGHKPHVPETGPREAREISHYLNEMVDKLDEQERARRTILANVTHELARPLAGLRLGVESLQKGAIEQPELAEDLLGNMSQAIQQMELLLDDISLAISPSSQLVKLQCTYVSVQPFLQGIASRFWTMAEMRGVKLSVDVPTGLPQVFADERRLTQILGNLVHNAIKFSFRQGTIRLSAEPGENNTVRLIVQDRGRGIPLEEAEHVFTVFYQGEHGLHVKQGMGLGLSIALQLARLHGGNLQLRPNPAGGTIAILTMPAEPT